MVADPTSSDVLSCRDLSVTGCRVTIRCSSEDLPCAAGTDGESVVYVHVIDDPLAAEGLTPDDSLVGRVRRLISTGPLPIRRLARLGWPLPPVARERLRGRRGRARRGPAAIRRLPRALWRELAAAGATSAAWLADASRTGGSWPRRAIRAAITRSRSSGAHARDDDAPRQPDWDSCAKKVPVTFHAATFGSA
jgi:hypothetical protein